MALGISPLAVLVTLLGSFSHSVAFGGSSPWPVPGAVLKFTIEADPNDPPTPGIDLSGQTLDKMTWSGAYYRIDGKIYKNAVAMTCPGTATYACKETYRRFVASIGVREDAGDTAAIVFEVFAGTRKLYTSPPMTKYCTPRGIDIRIPGKTKELRLVTRGSSSQGHHWAGWVNAGFPTREDDARVGYVTLPVAGFDPAQYEVVVFSSNGKRVPATRLAALEEGKVEQLFFSGEGWSTYYAYWVPKDKYERATVDWLPNGGLVLETRRVDQSRQRDCQDLPGLVKAWNEAGRTVGRSLVAGIHHGHPIHPRLMNADPQAARNSLALYRYTGFFEAHQAGAYVFATASTGGSFLLVDDRLVASWPGNHDCWGGIRGEKQGRITLPPGIHKLDYFNCNAWGAMLTLAAWQPPGGKLGVMTGNDFPSARAYAVTAVECAPEAEKKVCLDWNVVDDWRLDRDKVGLIRMRFRAVPAPGVPGRTSAGTPDGAATNENYRWTFDDGTVKTGRTVERVFFAPGKHTATVQRLKDSQVRAETTQAVSAGALAEKLWVEPRDRKAFQHQIAQINFRRAPLQEVTRLYALGQEMPEPSWQATALPILLERVDELMSQPPYQPLCLELGQHLTSAAVQRYDQALSLYTKLQEKTRAGTSLHQQTMILEAELLLRCQGQAQAALPLLNQARWEKGSDKSWTIRLDQARAEALLALGDKKELDAQMHLLQGLGGKTDPRRQELRREGLLEQASRLARVKDDPVQWDYARENLETILREEPEEILSPRLNLIRLDIHLARGEYRVAHHLAERLVQLELPPYDHAQVLVRHVRALCAMNDVNAAQKVLEELTRIYPNSEPTAQARALVVEAATKARRR